MEYGPYIHSFTTIKRQALVVALLATGSLLCAQTPELPTRGREFWLGFMQNAYGAQNLRVQIASTGTATSGTVSMPLTGWSAPFAVSAGGVTVITVPNTAEHIGGGTVTNKAVLVQSQDSVTVTAVSFQSFTTDATQVLPVQGLSTNYIAQAYRGLPGFADFYKSELLVVATADGTQIQITPSVNTVSGNAAGIPFIVNLNAGETYQVQSALASLDLTGTFVTGTPNSGPCRPFAVFGGSMCANVPVACPACDHLFEQMTPVNTWGTNFFTLPLTPVNSSSYRIVAAQSGTSVSVDGAAPTALNAGQSTEVNGSVTAHCITSNLPISVTQIMEGYNCAGAGDPSMFELLPQERLTTSVTFSTITSAQVTSHRVAVVTPTVSTAQVSLDGAAVSGIFLPYPACPSWSHAVVSVTAGTHTLTSSSGFIAYAYGAGTGESYGYALSNNAPPIVDQDTLICSSGPVTLTAPILLDNPYWVAQSDPNTTLAVGLSYTFTPGSNDTFTVYGDLPVSGCPQQFDFNVGIPVDPSLQLSANNLPGITVCQFAPVQLNATPTPDPQWYTLLWSPAGVLSDPTIPNPIAYPTQNTWFRLDVTSPIGCGSFTDSLLVNVQPNLVYAIDAQANDNAVCVGQQVQLHAAVEMVVASDLFDPAVGLVWTSIQGGVASNACGAVTGNALYFNGPGLRSAQMVALNTATGGFLHFTLKIANSTAPCDNADPGEDVRLEYSTNGGGSWNPINTYNETAYPAFTPIHEPIPAGAQSANTLFRWRQLANSGANQDNWALDNVLVTTLNNTTLSYSWTSPGSLNNAGIADPIATPTSAGWSTVIGTDSNSGCSWVDSVFIDVQPAFSISSNNDTTLCAGGGVQLNTIPNSGSGINYAWTPNNGTLSSTSIANPIATPTTTTTYTVTATTNIGCSDTESITITVGQLSGINVSTSDPMLCQGESAQLNAAVTGTGPYTLAWTPNNGTLTSQTAPNPIATPGTTTTYTCTATHTQSGCTVSNSVTITVNGPYSISTTPDDTLCSTLGFQLNVQHNVPGSFGISWSNAQFLNSATIASPTILVDTTATYVVTVTDANGCVITDSVTITSAFDNLLTPVNVSECDGDLAILNAGYPGSTYDWTTNQSTQIITVSTSGQYVVTITDAQGCVTYKTFNVLFQPLPVVDLGPDSVLCGASSYVLNAQNAGSSFLWSTSAPTQTITVTGDGTYWVQVTDGNLCSAVDSVVIDFAPMPVDNLQDVTACVTNPPLLDAGNAGSTYQWNTGPITQTIVANASSTYSVVVTTPDDCSATFDAVVDLAPALSVDLGPDTVLCDGASFTLDAGSPGSSYSWNTNDTSQTITVSTTDYYSVTVSNGACSASDAIDVVFHALPVDNLVDVTHCIDQPIILDAGNWGSTYTWSNGDTTQAITVPFTGQYTVTVTNAANCSATFDAVATYINYPLVDLGADTVLCEGDVLTLDAGNPGSSFTWNTGEHTQILDVTSTNTYSVEVDNGYCTGRDAIVATFNPRPSRMPMHDLYSCLEEEPHFVVIDAGNAGSDYDWSTGETSQVILAGAYGWYFVQVTNQFDCSLQDSARVIEFCPPSIFVPNTFTPNGDGVNDIWMPAGKNVVSLDLYVFDRWGGMLFESHSLDQGWDGTMNGSVVKNDVYVWRMEYRFLQDKEGTLGPMQKQMGHVTVLR